MFIKHYMKIDPKYKNTTKMAVKQFYKFFIRLTPDRAPAMAEKKMIGTELIH